MGTYDCAPFNSPFNVQTLYADTVTVYGLRKPSPLEFSLK